MLSAKPPDASAQAPVAKSASSRTRLKSVIGGEKPFRRRSVSRLMSRPRAPRPPSAKPAAASTVTPALQPKTRSTPATISRYRPVWNGKENHHRRRLCSQTALRKAISWNM